MNTFRAPISQSTLHIYLFALPFCPLTSNIFNSFSSLFTGTLRVYKGAATGWPTMQHIIECQSLVVCIAFLPDGMWIISSLFKLMIWMWDSSIGNAISQPLKGHTGLVISITFSLDGMWIILGLSNWTIQIWDSSTGKVIGQPLEGHRGLVWSIAFSPDGTWIMSGSEDKTIWMWDSLTGKVIS